MVFSAAAKPVSSCSACWSPRSLQPARSCLSLMTPSSGAGAPGFLPTAFIAMPCAPRIRILSKPAGCAASACCCYFEERKLRPKVLTGWARQLVLVADGGFASLALLKSLSIRSVICVTRMRLDVRLFSPAPPRKKGTKGRPRLVSRDEPPLPIRWVLIRDPKGKFETPAILCAGLNQTPHQIVEWFLLRWQAASHLLRCNRLGARTPMASLELFHLPFNPAQEENTTCVARWFDADGLLCGMSRQRLPELNLIQL